jgi:hypothetical protein
VNVPNTSSKAVSTGLADGHVPARWPYVAERVQRCRAGSAYGESNQGAIMVLSVSGVLLLGVIVFILFRKDGLKVSHMIVCMLFGFYLASTSIAASIRNSTGAVTGFISGLHF